MISLPKFSRRTRWAVPGAVLAAVAAVTAGALVTTAQASPVLPSRTPAQLLAAVAATKTMPALTGSIDETAALGLPQLPGTSDTTSVTSLLTGSHTVRIWYADQEHVRLAVPGMMSETDMVRSGTSAWLWQSSTDSVTHYLLPSQKPEHVSPPMPALTPQQAANQAIKQVGPTTRVSVQSNVVVAGQAAYQLVLQPKSHRSLIGQVRIAVDAAHSVPLRVQLFARHASSPAFQVGFTSISFVRPAASNFRFTPPPGAKVSTSRLTASDVSSSPGPGRSAGQGQPTMIGHGWLAVAEFPAGAMSGLGLGGPVGIHGGSPVHGQAPAGSGPAAVGGAAGSAAKSVAGSAPAGASPGEYGAVLYAMLKSAKQVHGSWGSGRLLQTSLVSVLFTSDGKVFAGAVTPPALYAAAAHAR
jgi:outer membrane lipoprotein-sorting protein